MNIRATKFIEEMRNLRLEDILEKIQVPEVSQWYDESVAAICVAKIAAIDARHLPRDAAATEWVPEVFHLRGFQAVFINRRLLSVYVECLCHFYLGDPSTEVRKLCAAFIIKVWKRIIEDYADRRYRVCNPDEEARIICGSDLYDEEFQMLGDLTTFEEVKAVKAAEDFAKKVYGNAFETVQWGAPTNWSC